MKTPYRLVWKICSSTCKRTL